MKPSASAIQATAHSTEPWPPALLRLAGEDVRVHQRLALDLGREIVLEAAGKVERRLRRDVVDAVQQLRCRSSSGSRRRRTDRPWSAPS